MAGKDLNIILRLLWFYFIGLPIGAIWLNVAWFFGITIIGLPICIWMINEAPGIMTLKQQHRFKEFKVGNKTAYFIEDRFKQTSFFWRALYFLLIGWWLSLVWIEVSLIASATFIFIPLGFWMINRLPFVMTLRQD